MYALLLLLLRCLLQQNCAHGYTSFRLSFRKSTKSGNKKEKGMLAIKYTYFKLRYKSLIMFLGNQQLGICYAYANFKS